jgi:hypothetical protein
MGELMNSLNLRIILLFAIIKNSLFLEKNEKNKKTIYESKYISLPFKQKNPYYRRYPPNYSSVNFINDFFTNNLLVDMNLGTPIQDINLVLKPSSSCFTFIEKMRSNNINKNTISKYIPKKSLTFLLNKNSRGMTAEDLFLFKDENNKNIFNNIHIPFSLELDLGEINEETEFIGELGLNSKFGLNDKNCPNFMSELKKKKDIKEKIFSLVYKHGTKGNLFIGNSLYNINGDIYKKNNFFKINVIKDKNGVKWNINFDKLYIHDLYLEGNNTLSNKANEGKIYLNTKQVNIKIDQKIMIGTSEYKKMIDNLYFNKLIKSNICKYEIVPFNSRNYYIYSCTALLFATFESVYPDDDFYQEPIYHYLHFPSLIFQSDTLKYSFELKYEDLFQLSGGRFYFMVIFDSDEENKNSQEWTIGEQFIKKHTFSFNIDRKSILFYNEKQFNDNFEENDAIEYDNLEKKENKNIFIIILIVAGICFSILSFYLGIKIRERRKKRANELRDEYEYVSERETNNMSINSTNNYKNSVSKNEKTFKEIELNIQYLTQVQNEENKNV